MGIGQKVLGTVGACLESRKKTLKLEDLSINMPKNKILNVKIVDPLKIRDDWGWKILILIAPILLSLLAILISLNVHSPFNPEVHSSGVYVLLVNTSDYDKPTNRQAPTFILPIEFINSGAKPGVIEEIHLIFKKENDMEFKDLSTEYFPKYEIDINKLNQVFYYDPSMNKNPFQSFGLGGEEALEKNIIFSPKLPGYIIPTEVGNYSIQIFIKDSKSDKFSNRVNLSIKINEQLLDHIKAKDLVFIRSPQGYEISGRGK